MLGMQHCHSALTHLSMTDHSACRTTPMQQCLQNNVNYIPPCPIEMAAHLTVLEQLALSGHQGPCLEVYPPVVHAAAEAQGAQAGVEPAVLHLYVQARMRCQSLQQTESVQSLGAEACYMQYVVS